MSEASLRLLLSALDGTKHGVDEVAESWALCENKLTCAIACVSLRTCGRLLDVTDFLALWELYAPISDLRRGRFAYDMSQLLDMFCCRPLCNSPDGASLVASVALSEAPEGLPAFLTGSRSEQGTSQLRVSSSITGLKTGSSALMHLYKRPRLSEQCSASHN